MRKSYYVYLSYVDFRRDSFTTRLMRKAYVVEQALGNPVISNILASLPEQVEYVYAPDNTPLYHSLHGQDFQPTPAFLAHVRQEKEHAFSFSSPGHRYPKDGVAIAYRPQTPPASTWPS